MLHDHFKTILGNSSLANVGRRNVPAVQFNTPEVATRNIQKAQHKQDKNKNVHNLLLVGKVGLVFVHHNLLVHLQNRQVQLLYQKHLKKYQTKSYSSIEQLSSNRQTLGIDVFIDHLWHMLYARTYIDFPKSDFCSHMHMYLWPLKAFPHCKATMKKCYTETQ